MTTSIAIPESAERMPVNTVADILRAMARDPAVAEAVRQHILDDELRRLPSAFLQLAAKVEQHLAESARIHAELQAGQARLEAGQARHDANIAELRAGQDELRAGQARHDADIAELRAGQARLEAGQEELRAGQARHDADIAELRAGQDELRAGQARLEAGQEELRAGQARHDADIAELRAGQDELRAGQARLEAGQEEIRAGQARHDADIAVLRAKATVTDARSMVGSICDLASLRRSRWLESTEVLDLIEDADEAVLNQIPINELRSCQQTDLILSATSKIDGSRQFFLVECTAGITRRDIQRIRRNADHFARITGCVTHAAVIGRLPPPNILADAHAQNVHCVEPSAKVTRPT